jgi:hypothetical protein
MGGRRGRRAGIEIETVASGGCPAAVVIRLTGVVDAPAVMRLRDVLACLEARPVVIDVAPCTLASRQFGHLVVELCARARPCLVACPRVGPRLLLGRRADEALGCVHGSVADALAALALAVEPATPPDAQASGELCAPADRAPAYT